MAEAATPAPTAVLLLALACACVCARAGQGGLGTGTHMHSSNHSRTASALFEDTPFLQPQPQVLAHPSPAYEGAAVRQAVAQNATTTLVLYRDALFTVTLAPASASPVWRRLDDGEQLRIAPSSAVAVSETAPQRLVVCDEQGCQACGLPVAPGGCVHHAANLSGIAAICARPQSRSVLVAVGDGVAAVDAQDASVARLAGSASGVLALAVSLDGTVAAWATAESVELRSLAPAAPFSRVWYVSQREEEEVTHNTSVGAMVDGRVSAMAFDGLGVLWVGSDQCLNLLLPDYSWRRLDAYHNGLPFANVTALVPQATDAFGPEMWVATTQGLLRYNYTTRRFHCFSSQGYIRGPSPNVTALAQHGAPGLARPDQTGAASPPATSVLLGTASGALTVLRLRPYTLADKAAAYQALINPRHNRHGLVAPCGLAAFGNLSSWVGVCGDNDGLHTAEYLASQAYRFAVTGDAAVKREAWRHVEALEMLHNLTGDSGFFARTFFHWEGGEACAPGGGRWYNSSAVPGWTWKGDTSSDEVTGHYYAYAVAESLLATTDAERARVRRLVTETLRWILHGNYTLVSPETGRPTTWARWNPGYVNHNRTSRDDRGEQSLEMLSYLLVGYGMTNDAQFLDAMHALTGPDNRYDLNLINSNTEYPLDIVHFDHHLVMINLQTVVHTLNGMDDAQFARLPAGLPAHLNASLTRLFSFTSREHNALFANTFALARLFCPRLDAGPSAGPRIAEQLFGAPESDPLAQLRTALAALAELPLSQVDFPGDNTRRGDLGRSPYSPGDADRVLPLNEIPAYLRWSENPYALVGGSGLREFAPTQFLLEYWKLRYYGVLA